MTTVLLVGDDEADLEVLRDGVVRIAPDTWELSTVVGGRAALGRLSARAYDVVVTDEVLHGVDGMVVLRTTRGRAPASIRIVLSDDATGDRALGMLDVAHRVVQRPSRPAVLVAEIHSALALHDEASAEALRTVVAAIGHLPSTPTVLHELTALVHDEDSTAADAAELVRADPALVARILRLANSSWFGRRQPTEDLGDAISHLGLELLQSVVLQSEVGRVARAAPQADRDRIERRAAAAGRLARDTAPTDLRGAAMSAVALLDIGELLLAAVDPDGWDRLTAEAPPMAERLDRERELFGTTHPDAGAALLALWGLPPSLVRAVRHHHDPAHAPGDRLVAIVHLLDVATSWLAGGAQGAPAPDDAAVDEAGLRPTMEAATELGAQLAQDHADD